MHYGLVIAQYRQSVFLSRLLGMLALSVVGSYMS
jgi:hypothetical protein